MATILKTPVELLVAITLLLLTGVSFGRNDKTTGEKLIEKARELTDIRAEGAPAFRLEGTFRIIPRKGGEQIEGTYREIWLSTTKWRREVQTNSFHRVEVALGDEKWLADSGSNRPDAVLYGPLTLVFPKQTPKVQHISERELGTTKATCVELRADAWSKGIDCVDPDNGVFLLQENVMSLSVNFPSAHHSCVYRDYEKFGDRLFPLSIHCTNDPGDNVELTIVKLAKETSTEESLFSRPPDAVEMRTCHGRTFAPHAVVTPNPSYPPGHDHKSVIVVVSIIIDENGKPLDPEIARSAGKDFDQAALDTIRNWRFNAGTCDGVPHAVRATVEMSFW